MQSLISKAEEVTESYYLKTKNLNEFISGIILYDETIKQNTSEGIPFPKYLSENGIIPGIKVDKGAIPLDKDSGEKFTEGLDGLNKRLEDYKKFANSSNEQEKKDNLKSFHNAVQKHIKDIADKPYLEKEKIPSKPTK